MELTPTFEFNSVFNENHERKNNVGFLAHSKFQSRIYEINGMIVELYAAGKTLEPLKTESHLNAEWYPSGSDRQNIPNVIKLIDYKQAEIENAKTK